MTSNVEGLQGFALAAACLQLLIAAVLWGLRRWMPARGLDWLAAELARREQAEAALRALNQDLEQRIEARTGELREMVSGLESFNRMVSHDLRGPLGGLQGLSTLALQALETGDLARARRFIGMVETETARLGGLLQDLLTLARVGHQPLTLHPTPLDEVLEATLQTLSLADGDAVRARAGRPPAPGPGRRGPAERLFQPFGRLHGADVAGHGIGLTIVRRIVERHGGRVWAQGRPGQGASFFFSLPAA